MDGKKKWAGGDGKKGLLLSSRFLPIMLIHFYFFFRCQKFKKWLGRKEDGVRRSS